MCKLVWAQQSCNTCHRPSFKLGSSACRRTLATGAKSGSVTRRTSERCAERHNTSKTLSMDLNAHRPPNANRESPVRCRNPFGVRRFRTSGVREGNGGRSRRRTELVATTHLQRERLDRLHLGPVLWGIQSGDIRQRPKKKTNEQTNEQKRLNPTVAGRSGGDRNAKAGS